jgi:hypothetical protein
MTRTRRKAMKKIAIASVIALSTLIAQSAVAQTAAGRDRAIARLTDGRDMTTGLAMNAPPRNETGLLSGTARDKAIARLTDSLDMSTGFPH